MNRLRQWPWLGLVVLVASACGPDHVAVRVKDNHNEVVAGVEIIDATTHRYIGVTNRMGEVSVPLLDGTRLIQPTHPGVAGQPIYEFKERIHRLTKAHGKTPYLVWAMRAAANPDAARLAVRSSPEGAELLINGQPVGPTPVVLSDFAPGSMVTLTFKMAGYALHKNTVLVDQGLMEIAADLGSVNQQAAPVELVSIPAGARVEIDGRATGRRTPAQFNDLSSGQHRVRLTMDGFRPLETDIRLDRGTRHVEHLGRMIPMHGDGALLSKSYVIRTSPHYAEIYIDGEPGNQNETGAFSIHLDEGMHRFWAVNKDLGLDLSFRYAVRADDPNDELQIDLEKGRVVAPNRIRRKMYTVLVRPHWAEVYVDGEAFSRNAASGFDVMLEQGQHRFHVVNAGAALDTVFDYSIDTEDENDVLVLDWRKGSVQARRAH